MQHSSKTRLLSGVVIAAVFGAGLLIGFVADTSLEAETSDGVVDEVGEDESDDGASRSPMWAQLDPTADQQAAIEAIILVHRERTNALDKETRRTYRQGFRGIVLETREAIKEVFPPEQADEYQRLLDEWDAQQAAEREDRAGRK